MVIVCAVFLFILGAVFGSFVGAFTWRLKYHKDWVKGRSECEHCHHKLTPLDLIPVISWISLGGRCRYCRKPIGWTTLLLELGLGAAFVVSFYFLPITFGFTPAQLIAGRSAWLIVLLAVWLIMLIMLAALLVYDAKWHLLPNKIMYPLIALALIYTLIASFAINHMAFMTWLGDTLLAMLPVAGLYGVLWLFSGGRWIGLGDVKLGVVVGLCLGWQLALAVLAISNAIASLSVIPLLITKKLKPSSQIAFGPFLIVTLFAMVLFGNYLCDWLETIVR